MAEVRADMTARKLFSTWVITFRCKSATEDGGSQRSISTGARLRLTVDDRTLFAETQVTGFSTFVFATVKRLVAGKIAGVHFWEG
jgi:hypothetical protein